MDIYSILLTVMIMINLLFAGVIIFIERKDATSTWAWLMILFFIPFLGFIIYMFLGQTLTRKRLFDWEGIKKIGLEEKIDAQMDQIKHAQFRFENTMAEQYRDFIYMHLINNDALLTKGNEVDIISDGRKKFDALLADIRQAKSFIHIQYYIIKNDELGKQIIQALVERAQAGVKVRILYDELGSRKLRRKHFAELEEAGGEVGVFFPSKLALINLRLNFRNHRKLVNIDGFIGYIGGFNVGDEYIGESERFGYWRDTHLRIKGPAVDAIQTRFMLDWNQASKRYKMDYEPRYFPKKEPTGAAAMQIVSSGPDSEWEQIKNGYIYMIMSAKESVYIQTPYFIPDQSLFDALRIAALSGKDVRIMIPNRPDHPFVYWATFSNAGDLIKTGAKIYIYEKGFIHAKTIVIDRKINSVGSANIDVRSFKLNFEVNAFIYDEETSKELARLFEQDMEDSKELTPKMYEERSRVIRFKESISRLLSPIL